MVITPVAIAAPLPLKEFDATTTIEKIAEEHGLNSAHFLAVAACEDPGFVPDQQSHVVRRDGSREPSYGVWQIDQDFHSEIPLASSTDLVWATEWAAGQWAIGHEHGWSCYAIEEAKDWQ